MSQSRVGEARNSLNNNNYFNTVNSFGSAERAEILAWLSPLEPWIRHDDIRTYRVDGVGDWLLKKNRYRNWFDGIHTGKSHNSVLFIDGDPGVGKTYIR